MKETGVVASSKASVALLLLWIAITVGRLVGLQDQIMLKKQPTRALFSHLAGWLRLWSHMASERTSGALLPFTGALRALVAVGTSEAASVPRPSP